MSFTVHFLKNDMEFIKFRFSQKKKKKKVFFLPFSGILCLFILGWIGLNQYVAKVTSTRSIFIYFKMNKLAMSMRN